jgi:hypothetical protein
MGKGNINILTKKGEKMFISDVCFVLGLKHILMSIMQLLQKGYRIFFKKKQCTILDKFPSNQLIDKVQMRNNIMFPLRLKPDLKVELAQGPPSTNSQEDEEKTTTVTQVIFQA